MLYRDTMKEFPRRQITAREWIKDGLRLLAIFLSPMAVVAVDYFHNIKHVF